MNTMPIDTPPRHRTKRSLSVCTLLFTLLSFAIPTTAQATPKDWDWASFNMRGRTHTKSNGRTVSTWDELVACFLNNGEGTGVDFIVLQETGSHPPTTATTTHVNPVSNIIQVGTLIYQYDTHSSTTGTWHRRTRTARVQEMEWLGGLYIYHVQILHGHNNGVRTNMAIVSRYRASRVILLPPMNRSRTGTVDGIGNNVRLIGHRPVLGLEFNTGSSRTAFYNIHAAASDRNEASLTSTFLDSLHDPNNSPMDNNGQISDIFSANANMAVWSRNGNTFNQLANYPSTAARSYILSGDFNVDLTGDTEDEARSSFQMATHQELLRTERPTHGSNGNWSELDYAMGADFNSLTDGEWIPPSILHGLFGLLGHTRR